MAFDQGLAERVRDALNNQAGIVEKTMFGGLAFMQRGHMFVGIIGDQLMVRVGPAAYQAALADAHVTDMDFNGKPMRGYVFVEAAGYEDDADLARWIDRALAPIATLAEK